MKALLKALHAKLTTIADRVYYEQADTDATYPYVIYNRPASVDDYDADNVIIDIDVWGTNPDTSEIDTISDNIRKGLNKYSYCNEDVGFTAYYQNGYNVPDDDETFRRRRLTFVVNTYYND